MVEAYVVLSGLGVALWTPILLRFYRSWIGRGNPVSLAICAKIALLIWSSIAGIWVVTGGVRDEVLAIVSCAISVCVAGYTHFAFRWSEKNFNSQRRAREN